MPQLCRYWQQGNCKYGDNCRFDHGKDLDPRNLSDAELRQLSTDKILYIFDKQAIINDLTVEKPKWVLSAFGPGRQAPAQLFGGFPREQSFEEIRLLHFMASSDQNRLQQVILSVNKLIGDSEQQIQYIVQNIDAAVKYLTEARKHHPNRVDICRESEQGRLFITPTGTQNSSSFQIPQAGIQDNRNLNQQIYTAATNFGKPSAPVFGIPTPAASVFGKISTLGQRANPFANVTPTSGLPTQSSGVFVNPQTVTGNFVSAGQALNPFEKAKLDSSKNQSSTGNFGNQNSFSSTSFVKFGLPSVANQAQGTSFLTTQSKPCFSQGPAIPSKAPAATFNKVNQPGSNYFSPLSNVGDKSSMENNSHPQPTHLSRVSHNQAQTDNSNTASQSIIGNTSNQPAGPYQPHQNPNHLSSPSDHQKGLETFKNKTIRYKNSIPGFINNQNNWEKIWFLDEKPVFSKDLKMPPETVYDELTVKAYAYARQNKKFEGGLIPALPPKEEWCSFDF